MEAIRLNPRSSEALNNLAAVLEEDELVELPVIIEGLNNVGPIVHRGRFGVKPKQPSKIPVTREQLLTMAIHFNKRNRSAYRHLAVSLGNDPLRTITLRDGRVLNSRQLFVEAVASDPNNSRAFVGLAVLLQAGERITLRGGRVVNSRQLLIDAFSKDFNTFYARSPQPIDFNAYSEHQAYVLACKSNDMRRFATWALQRRLQPGETVVLANGDKISAL